MSRYRFSVSWIRPNGVSVDITDRVILDSVGSLTEEQEPPDELFSYTAGDWTFAADNSDGFFADEVKSDLSRSDRLNDLSVLFAVECRGTPLSTGALPLEFRGYVLPKAVTLDRASRRASITVLGPMRLLDTTSAEGVRRYFGGLRTSTVTAAGASSVYVNQSNVRLVGGDQIKIAGKEYRVTGFTTNRITLAAAVEESIGAGEPVEVLTPYLRNQLVEDLAEALFREAGIVSVDVRYTGLVAWRPFQSGFNTSAALSSAYGLEGFGALRGLQAGTLQGTGTQYLRAGMEANHASGSSGLRDSASQSAGFAPATGGANVLASATDHGGHDSPLRNGLAAKFWASGSSNYPGIAVQTKFDSLSSGPKILDGTRIVLRSAWSAVQGATSTAYLYELRYSHIMAPEDPVPGRSTWSIRVYRWTSTNFGRTWAADSTFNLGSGYYQLAGSTAETFQTGEDFQWSVDAFISTPFSAGWDHLLYVCWFDPRDGIGRASRLTFLGNGLAEDSGFATGVRGMAATYTKTRAYYDGAGLPHSVEVYLDTVSQGLILRKEWASGYGFTYQYVGPIAPGVSGLAMRTLRWNGRDDGASRVALLASSPDGGTRWLILYPGTTEGVYPATQFAVEYSGTIDPVTVHGWDWPAKEATGDLHLQAWNHTAQLKAGQEIMVAPLLLTPWNITIGVSSETVWVFYAAGKLGIISKSHTGFLSYADFDGLTCADALAQLGFIVNARPGVEWERPAEVSPRGLFVSRDLEDPEAPKSLEGLDGSPPAGEFQPFVLGATYRRAAASNVARVVVTGPDDSIRGEAGSLDLSLEGVEISSRFCESPDLAEVMAEQTFSEIGPGVITYPAPTATYSAGSYSFEYAVVGFNSAGERVGITEALRLAACAKPSLGTPVTLTWLAMDGAASYGVWRTYVEAGTELGRWATTYSGWAMDSGGYAVALPFPSILRAPRPDVDLLVRQDGTRYYPGRLVRVRDAFGRVDPTDPNKPPVWRVEAVERKPGARVVNLRAVQRDVFE